jgi:hypothetical protein
MWTSRFVHPLLRDFGRNEQRTEPATREERKGLNGPGFGCCEPLTGRGRAPSRSSQPSLSFGSTGSSARDCPMISFGSKAQKRTNGCASRPENCASATWRWAVTHSGIPPVALPQLQIYSADKLRSDAAFDPTSFRMSSSGICRLSRTSTAEGSVTPARIGCSHVRSPPSCERRAAQVAHHQLCGVGIESGLEQVEQTQMIFKVSLHSGAVSKGTISEQAAN